MIAIKNVKKVFNPHSRNRNEVLKGVSFELPDKGLIAIFGKSGSGKTTLLNIIGGLDRPDGGEIEFDGVAVTGRNSDYIRNSRTGFVFQNYYLEKGFTISEIMSNAMTLAGFKDKTEIARRTEEVLSLVGMQRYANKKGDALSGGQKQRVAIARALIKGADIILADEPTGNLDAENTAKVMDILKEISATRLVVVVTHELSLIEKYADDFIRIVDGRITQDDETREIVAGYALSGKSDVDAADCSQEVMVPVYENSSAKKNGRLFSCKSIFKNRKKESRDRFYSTANIFKQIFIAAISVVVTMLAFQANEMINFEVQNRQTDANSVYVNMNTYADIRNLDPSLYSNIDFFDTEMRRGTFGYSGLSSLSGAVLNYTPKSIGDGDTLLSGKAPSEGEVAVSRGLAQSIKSQMRLAELDNDASVLRLTFDHTYPVCGIVDADYPAVFFTRTDYVNFLGVYNAIKFSDAGNILLSEDYAEVELSATVRVSEEVKDNDKIIVELNRNSLYKMMSDSNNGYYVVENVNTALAHSPYAIQLRDSGLFVQKVAITRESIGTDVIIFVSENVMKNLFAYLSPNFDALEGNDSTAEPRYYFEIKTDGENEKSTLTALLAQKSIRSIDILGLYGAEEQALRQETMKGLTVFYVLIVLLLLIYYFIEKSGSIKNIKEYGIYRAIGVNRGNLIFREAMTAVFDNMAIYLGAWLLTAAIVCARYFVMNVAFGSFVGLSVALITLCGVLMTGISLVPYLFVITQSPAKILAKYDI